MSKKSAKVSEKKPATCGLSRRDFIKFSTIAGGATAAFLGGLPGFSKLASLRAQSNEGNDFDYTLLDPANQLYSVCLQCNSGCGIKVKLLDSVAAKIEGNPFHPTTMYPHIPYETPVSELSRVTKIRLCSTGQTSQALEIIRGMLIEKAMAGLSQCIKLPGQVRSHLIFQMPPDVLNWIHLR